MSEIEESVDIFASDALYIGDFVLREECARQKNKAVDYHLTGEKGHS